MSNSDKISIDLSDELKKCKALIEELGYAKFEDDDYEIETKHTID